MNRQQRSRWFVAALVFTAVALAACRHQKVDAATDRLKKSFVPVTGEAKSEVTAAITALHNRDFATALPLLESAFNSPDITLDQKLVLSDVINETALELDRRKAAR